ncbi:MAG: hypothetical protein ACYTAF_17475 [Planctomycetota bacterium]
MTEQEAKSLARRHGSRRFEGTRSDGPAAPFWEFSLDAIGRMAKELERAHRERWLPFARHLATCPRKGNAPGPNDDCTCGLTRLTEETA